MKQNHPDLSVRRQCSLLSLARSSLHYQPRGESAENLAFMEIIDKQVLEPPWYGSRQMARHMRREGHQCGRHRVRRLMRLMRLVPIHQEPKTSKKHPDHKIHPYLLRDLSITRPNQVWCTDITYIPMRRGFLYLVAVMDWHSRKVLSWRLSNTMDAGFCVDVLKDALARYDPPEIFNSPSRDISCGNTLPGNGSGLPVHQHRLHRRAARRQGEDIHGRARPLDRQPND